LLEMNESGKSGEQLSQVVLGYRSLLLTLCKKVSSSGGGLSLCISLSMIVNFARCLYAIYQIATVRNPEYILLWLPFFVYGFIPIVATCEYCQRVEDSVFFLNNTQLKKINRISRFRSTKLSFQLWKLPKS